MSRSKRKHAITGITMARSEKKDKRLANRRLRRKANVKLRAAEDDTKLPTMREVSNVWSMDKDGKRFFDAKKNPKLLRK